LGEQSGLGEMDERRTRTRARSLKAAKIKLAKGAAVIDCIVKNFSATGACLEVVTPVGIPEAFDLVFENDHTALPCRVMWRKAHRIGIKFLQ
jgi:hypothetical protein